MSSCDPAACGFAGVAWAAAVVVHRADEGVDDIAAGGHGAQRCCAMLCRWETHLLVSEQVRESKGKGRLSSRSSSAEPATVLRRHSAIAKAALLYSYFPLLLSVVNLLQLLHTSNIAVLSGWPALLLLEACHYSLGYCNRLDPQTLGQGRLHGEIQATTDRG